MDIEELKNGLRHMGLEPCNQAAGVIESLQRKLEHATMAADAEAKYGDEARQERDRLKLELEEAREGIADELLLASGRVLALERKLEEARKDVENYRFLRDDMNNSLHLTRNGEHASS